MLKKYQILSYFFSLVLFSYCYGDKKIGIPLACIANDNHDFSEHEIRNPNLKLQISPNKRYIQYNDGTPFFWLGDTAWSIFYRLKTSDAALYFSDRKNKGFTIIQASILGPGAIDGLIEKSNSATGQRPFIDNNPENPSDNFFLHVDSIIDKAAEFGLFIGLLPTWGEYVCPAWGNGPKIFNTKNAHNYGKWLAHRYRNKTNIIWILGGDREGNHCGKEDLAIWRALAYGIKVNDKNHLMTYHPCSDHSSSEYFHIDTWIDFNMYESHKSTERIPFLTYNDYLKIPIKPVVNGEAFYYGYPQKAFDRIMRSQPYWTFLSGGAGFTFGQKYLWNFCKADSQRDITIKGCDDNWKNHLNSNGAKWVVNFKEFFNSIKWWTFNPDQTIIISGKGSGNDLKVAAKSNHCNMIIIYFPTNSIAKIDLTKIDKRSFISYYWFNPKNRARKSLQYTDSRYSIKLKPPKGWEDAILVLFS